MMIVALFVLFNYILDLVKAKFSLKKRPTDKKCFYGNILSVLSNIVFEGEAEITEENVRFIPPAFRQRNQAISEVINLFEKHGSIKKIVDFGCGELQFFNFVKHLNGTEEYTGVDIDGVLLRDCYTKIIPKTSDYLSKRSSPLKVSIFKGSVIDPDIRLKETNVAIATELIEHMYPPELIDLPYNIFGVIQPDIAIFTTPNADFNVLFPNFSGFRHPDHKFEWTREQFEDWGNNVALLYPSYSVIFHGIGKGPAWTEPLGCCSQMAIFVRNGPRLPCPEETYSEIYECIYEVQYPFQTPEEKLRDTLEYELHKFLNSISSTQEYVVGNQREIPADILLKQINVECSIEKFLDFLKTTENDVQLLQVNNKAILILPIYSSENSSVDGDDVMEYDTIAENYDKYQSNYDNWDIDVDACDGGKMKSNAIDDLDWGTPEISPTVETNNEPSKTVAEDTEFTINKEVTSESSKNNSGLQKDKSIKENSSPSISKKISTGAIPKQRIVDCEHSSSTSVSSDDIETSTHLIRTGGVTNIHENSSVFPDVLYEEFEESSQESFLEHVSNIPSSYKYPSTDLLKSFTGVQLSDSSFNDTKPSFSGGASGLASKIPNEPIEKLIHCHLCNQMYLNKHICLGTKQHKYEKQSELLKTSNESAKQFACGPGSPFHRSHSLDNVNISNGMHKNFRHSLNIDNQLIDCDTNVVDMDLEVCCKVSSVPSLCETFGSHSKAADSGYPNSVCDMDLDLTPEQVDEIITENESSLEEEDSSGEEGMEQVPGNAPVVFLDNVENGDVANNNRDGEGNNMEGGGAEVLGFEGLVLEERGEVEADQHESDDEGLYLSAIDVSNDTVVPEENSSHDETLFNTVYEGPSGSSIIQNFEIDSVQAVEDHSSYFPDWLLNILQNEAAIENGDSGIAIAQPLGVGDDSSVILLEDAEEAIEIIVPVDVAGGGDYPANV